MSVANFEFKAEKRDELGKGASRRLRQAEKVLGVVYGGSEAPVSISLEQREVFKALSNEAVYSHILTLELAGKKQKVVLRDMQRHPYKAQIQHMDFMRVKETDLITMRIPVHFVGTEESPGVKEGGILNHLISDIEVRCQAGSIPEFIEVDVANLELDKDIVLSQLTVPANVEILQLSQGHDLAVASVHLPRQVQEEEAPVSEEETGTEEGSEPEATDEAQENNG